MKAEGASHRSIEALKLNEVKELSDIKKQKAKLLKRLKNLSQLKLESSKFVLLPAYSAYTTDQSTNIELMPGSDNILIQNDSVNKSLSILEKPQHFKWNYQPRFSPSKIRK